MPPEGAETNLRVVGREPELTEDELRRHRDMQMSARLAEPEPEPEPEPRLDALSPESGQIDPQHRQHEQLELAQAQLAEERGRHDRLMREAEQTRAQLSEQLSSSLADLARARDGTQALLEEMREWNYFKAVVTCQRIVRRRQDARQFRCGFATQQARVSATVGGATHAAEADSTGRWTLDLSESQTDRPVSVTISATSGRHSSANAEAADERIVLKNVTFGEVSRHQYL